MKKIIFILSVLIAFSHSSVKFYSEQESLCEAGDMMNCFAVGISYMEEGSKKDYAKAMKFHQKACDGGVNFACYGLGVFIVKVWELM